MHKITVKIKETAGTFCIKVNQDKLYTLKQLVKWLKWAIKPVLQLLSWLGLNTKKLQSLNKKFNSKKTTIKNLA